MKSVLVEVSVLYTLLDTIALVDLLCSLAAYALERDTGTVDHLFIPLRSYDGDLGGPLLECEGVVRGKRALLDQLE